MCPKFEKYVAEMDNFRQWSLLSRKSNGRRYVKLKKYPVHQKNFQKNSLKVEIWRFRLLAHGIRITLSSPTVITRSWGDGLPGINGLPSRDEFDVAKRSPRKNAAKDSRQRTIWVHESDRKAMLSSRIFWSALFAKGIDPMQQRCLVTHAVVFCWKIVQSP